MFKKRIKFVAGGGHKDNSPYCNNPGGFIYYGVGASLSMSRSRRVINLDNPLGYRFPIGFFVSLNGLRLFRTLLLYVCEPINSGGRFNLPLTFPHINPMRFDVWSNDRRPVCITGSVGRRSDFECNGEPVSLRKQIVNHDDRYGSARLKYIIAEREASRLWGPYVPLRGNVLAMGSAYAPWCRPYKGYEPGFVARKFTYIRSVMREFSIAPSFAGSGVGFYLRRQ